MFLFSYFKHNADGCQYMVRPADGSTGITCVRKWTSSIKLILCCVCYTVGKLFQFLFGDASLLSV